MMLGPRKGQWTNQTTTDAVAVVAHTAAPGGRVGNRGRTAALQPNAPEFGRGTTTTSTAARGERSSALYIANRAPP